MRTRNAAVPGASDGFDQRKTLQLSLKGYRGVIHAGVSPFRVNA
jgi:hypothetical protein